MWIARFPWMYPITGATEYFGGIDNIMCTWSASRCPSSTALSRGCARRRNTSPKYRRSHPRV